MASFLVIHGAGMNMRGKAQIDVFGTMTLAEYDRHIRDYAAELGVSVDIFHSNVEGEIINRFYAANDAGIDGAVINPAGFTRGYPALTAAIAQVGFPVIELHVSNPARRGGVSDIAPACRGVVTGFGIQGYRFALLGLKSLVAAR